MSTAAPLHPTPWRTCRAIANHTRLHLFGFLLQHPGRTVSAVAAHTKQALPVTSQYLRVLEARGLLTARRVGRRVEYRPASAASGSRVTGLVAALRCTFEREAQPEQVVFKLATAFTHPRRIQIYHVLQTEPQTLEQLRAATGISGRALYRHLQKLERRGFVGAAFGRYGVMPRSDPLGRELARLAVE